MNRITLQLHIIALFIISAIGVGFAPTLRAEDTPRLLFMGDSMTGWMAERVNAYGEANGFEVATIVWDGSTIRKWGDNASKISQYVEELDPDVVFICLGLNESAEKNPQSRLSAPLSAILEAVGDREVIWVGPPSWPGKPFGEPLNGWLASQLGKGHYFESLGLDLPRQTATNPHPTRPAMEAWADTLMRWVPLHTTLDLPLKTQPKTPHSRGKTFIYRKMKETL